MEQTINQEEQIFLAALELEKTADRNEFLDKACGDNGILRRRVEDLLAFHQRGDNILDATSGGLFGRPAAEIDSISAGTQIGPYKLLQQIGVGGMGVVFMAEQQQPVRRKVAIKVIKLGMDTRSVIARFEAERQALAMMDHPNITKVFDAGITTAGRPYFVMELVTGLTITNYCDRESLSLRERIELFYQVCVGIKHAHQKGIIHRDLKPSNVMVTHYDGVPVPKIIDFGIAKAIDQTLTEKTLFTSYGNMIGTPEYMSPEQAEMSGQDIDTRADVYSLGVLMYELLTGTTPFYHWKDKGLHKICAAICHEEPELASTRINNLAETVKDVPQKRGMDSRSLSRFLRGDLDWILAKCMSKNRNERYETAADLARDVRHYLDGQPIEAVGPNVRYRAGKFIRKHRTSIALATTILVTLCAATVVSLLFAVDASRAQQLASHRLEEVDLLRKQAEIERDRARAAEARLQQLERQSRGEVTVARAIEEFRREFPEERIHVRYPTRQSSSKIADNLWTSDPDQQPNSAQNLFIVERTINPALRTEKRIVGVDSAQIQEEIARIKSNHPAEKTRERHSVFRIMVGDGGELNFQTEADFPPDSPPPPDSPIASGQVLILHETPDAGERKKFLCILADEQRQLFGPDDGVLANTLIELGEASINDQDWPLAENNLREGRDILKRIGKRSGRSTEADLARVELLLSKTLLKQEKTAAAKETLANGMGHLAALREIPDELHDVLQELRQNLRAHNIQWNEHNALLRGKLLRKRNGAGDEEHEIEIRIETKSSEQSDQQDKSPSK